MNVTTSKDGHKIILDRDAVFEALVKWDRSELAAKRMLERFWFEVNFAEKNDFKISPNYTKKVSKGVKTMSDGKNIRITNETFAKLETIKNDARNNGKRLSLGAIVDDLTDFREKLPYATKVTDKKILLTQEGA